MIYCSVVLIGDNFFLIILHYFLTERDRRFKLPQFCSKSSGSPESLSQFYSISSNDILPLHGNQITVDVEYSQSPGKISPFVGQIVN
jgi:hypothetical protein